jgi:hypothetical protein
MSAVLLSHVALRPADAAVVRTAQEKLTSARAAAVRGGGHPAAAGADCGAR